MHDRRTRSSALCIRWTSPLPPPALDPPIMRPTLLRAHQRAHQKTVFSVENVLNIFTKGARAGSADLNPLDLDHPIHKQPYDFGDFTTPTIMKMEKQRELLHYLRLEQHQFKDLGASLALRSSRNTFVLLT